MRASHGFLYCLNWILASVVAVAQANPIPFVDQPLAPTSAVPGGSGFTLTVNGAGFVSGSVVNWSGSPLPTTFVSRAQLTATVAASDIASAETVFITVVNPAPGGGTSNVAFFQVATPVSTVVLSTPSNTGGGGFAVVTADFNGDGRVDLAVTGTNGQNNPVVYILLGNGDGTFQSPVAYPISFSPIITAPMATGDFNGDGKLDLVAGQSVLLGNGDGSFQPAISLPAQYVPSDTDLFVAADFNGDGKLDLVADEEGEGDLLVMLGNGDGTFTALNPILVTTGITSSLYAADFNGDGVLDLLVDYNPLRFGSGTLAVYLGNGDGTFQAPVLTNAGVPSGLDVGLFAIAAADFNGDGKQDVASADSIFVPTEAGTLVGAVSLGEENGTFNFNANGFSLAETPDYQPAYTGDFNADGKLDVAMGTNIALGNGDGTFQTPPIALPNVSVAGIAAVGDFNGDGRLDFAVINQAANVLVELQAVGGVVQSTPSSLNFATPLVAGTAGPPQLVTLTNAGNATLEITSIAISGTNAGDFAQTNACGSAIAINASCQISATFSPTAGGTRTAMVQITDNALGSPQMVPLTGTGEDFSLTPSGQTTATVTRGQSASYTVSVAPGGGFSQTVALSCSGAPAQSTCSVSPGSLKLTGTSASTATVTVITAASSVSLTQPHSWPPAKNPFAVWALISGTLGLAVLTGTKQHRRPWRPQLLYGVALLCVLSLGITATACGGGSSGGSSSGTQAGTYTLTVTGTYISGSNTLTNNTKLTLVVQ